MMNKGIYYDLLDCGEKNLYDLILSAFLMKSWKIECGRIASKIDIIKVINMVLADNPNVFYFDKTYVLIEDRLGMKSISLREYVKMSELEAMQCDLSEAVEQAYRKIMAYNCDTGYEKLKHIYEYLQKNIKYDNDELAGFHNGTVKNYISHNAYGALINKRAVCDGIALAFALLCKRFKIECSIINGTSDYMSNGVMQHTWNIVKMNNRYFHFDPTWDINISFDICNYSYEYFGLDDVSIKNDHIWDYKSVPKCDSRILSYYEINDCFFSDLSQLNKYLCDEIKRKPKIIRFKLSNDVFMSKKNIDDYLSKKIIEIACDNGINKGIQYFWNEKTGCFFCNINLTK